MNFFNKSKMKLRKQFYEDKIVAYDQQANLYKQEMKYSQALQLHKKCYEMAYELYGKHAIETFICLNNLGRTYADVGDYSHALDAALEVYNHLKDILDHSRPEFIIICYNLGLSYQDVSDYQKSLEMFKQCYELSKTYYGMKNRDTLLYLYSLGLAYNDIGDYRKAFDIIQDTYHMQKSTLGETDIDTLKSFHELGVIGHQLGYNQEALHILEECYRILKRDYGDQNSETLSTYSDLGKLYLDMKEYSKAKEVFFKVYQIRKETLGETHVHTLITLSDLCILYYRMGEYKKGLEIAEKAYRQMKEAYGETCVQCLDLLQNYIRFMIKNHDIEKAIYYQEKLYHLKEKKYGYKDSKTLETLHDLSYLYDLNNQYLKSIELEEKCYVFKKKVLGESHIDTLKSLNQLAQFNNDAGHYEKALPYCLKAYELEKKIFGEKDETFIHTLSMLAQLYLQLANYEEALNKYEKCYTLQKEVFGENSDDALESLINMYVINIMIAKTKGIKENENQAFQLYNQIEEHLKNKDSSQFSQIIQMILPFMSSMSQNQKQSSQTIHLLEQYYEQLKQTKGSLYPETIDVLHMNAQAYDSCDPMKANQLYNEAYQSYCQVLGSEHIHTLLCLAQLALSYHKINDYSHFEVYAKRFFKDMKKQIYQHCLLDESSYKEFLQSLIILVQFYQSYYFNQGGSLEDYSYIAVYKNIVQDIEMYKFQLQNMPAYYQNVNQLRELENQIKNATEEDFVDIEKKRGYVLEHLEFITQKYQHQLFLDIDSSMIQQKLKGNEIILDYFLLLNQQYGLIMIGKNVFQSFIVEKENHYGLDKVKNHLDHIQHIYICPDGDLYHVSFERFIDKDISYLSSPKGLFYEGNSHTNHDIISFVSPDFNDSLDDDGFNQSRGEGKKSSLPGSLVEGHYIQNIFPDAKIYSGKKANATAFLNVKSPSVLHVSTHGEYLENEQNIMERGRLCLAGYNQTNHKEEYKNGYVSANDIQKDMNLKDTNLLVLSACLTAKGDVLPGEGIYGLRRAFELAGVKTMLITVEKINDHNAAIFMKIFYQKYHENNNVYQSFLETKEYLRDDSHALKELQIYVNEFPEYVSNVYPKSYRFIKRHLESYLYLCLEKGYLLRNEKDKEDWNGFIIQGKIE